MDLLFTADIRYCTKDCWFQVKEVDFEMAADVGSLQRFPKAIGSQSLAQELCLTGRKFPSIFSGYVNRVFATREQMVDHIVSVGGLECSEFNF